ncbi:MAG TPA: hypothetical protein VFH73_29155 [Polyangia bacterium]|jgi:hypothetical protein|nr:hypothetical protein [Polyangia bacterium]
MPLRRVSLGDLTIDDDAAVSGIEAYRLLKSAVSESACSFLVPEGATYRDRVLSWDRALFLNLTFWNGVDGVDVLCERHIPADVVAHVGWHHVVGRQIAKMAGDHPSGAAAMFFAESIASAFDLYMVGRLLPASPDCEFIMTQVPIMTEAAEEAGLPAADFAALLQTVADEPERAFEDLRALLLDAARGLLACRGAVDALRVLEGFAGHRFEPLLHHFQLSNWILYARAYGVPSVTGDEVVAGLDLTLRQSRDALGWLVDHWLTPQ